MEIIEIHRGHIKVKNEDKVATLYGEALVRIEGQNNPDYVVYLDSLNFWDGNESVRITAEEKTKLVGFIKEEFERMNMRLEVE